MTCTLQAAVTEIAMNVNELVVFKVLLLPLSRPIGHRLSIYTLLWHTIDVQLVPLYNMYFIATSSVFDDCALPA